MGTRVYLRMIYEFRNINQQLVPYNDAARKLVNSTGNHAPVKLKDAETDTGSLSMLQTWRMWMREVAAHMTHQGCTMPLYFDSKGQPHGTRPFNENDAHELFTGKLLGRDKDGKRLSWAKKNGEQIATKEQRLFAMDKLVVWATERGIPITIPNSGDYADFLMSQE